MSNTINSKSIKGPEQSLSERRPRSGKKTLILSNALGSSNDLGDKPRDRTAWSDPALTKKRLSSPLLTPDGSRDDPFAGMNSSINYQQEIERLKALVPKGDPKKRTPSRPRSTAFESVSSNNKPVAHTKSKSQTFPSSSSSSSTTPNAGNNRRTPTSPLSRSSRPQSAFYISTDSRASTPSSSNFFNDAAAATKMASPMATPRSLSPARSDQTSMGIHTVPEEDEDAKIKQEVISEEEKNRFLEFMRSWTGGLREWSHVDAAVDTGSNSGSSLWTQQTPWATPARMDRRRCSWQETQRRDGLTITLPDRNARLDTAMRSEPCTPLLAPR